MTNVRGPVLEVVLADDPERYVVLAQRPGGPQRADRAGCVSKLKGSRQRLPIVHSPNVKWSAGIGT